jgi:hypothetical protein
VTTLTVREERVSNDLYDLTEHLVKAGHETTGGFLGGEYGYGAFFENDIFMMHPYCWCEADDCDWCAGCLCPEEAYRHFLEDGTEVDGQAYYAAGGFRNAGARIEKVAELLCAYCKGERERKPNFLHKPSGTRVEWYKYIGRSMEIDLRADWHTLFNECWESIA